MERRPINSYGTITLPISMRRELGIEGMTELWVDVRTTDFGEKEIIIRKSDIPENILKRYGIWAEVIARIAESDVSIIWNGRLVSMSSSTETQSFIGTGIGLSQQFAKILSNFHGKSAFLKDGENVEFLSNGDGNVKALFKIPGDGKGYFIVVGGTKNEKSRITKADESRRFQMINDIVENIAKK